MTDNHTTLLTAAYWLRQAALEANDEALHAIADNLQMMATCDTAKPAVAAELARRTQYVE